jgi:hypothetical protein
MSPTTLPQVLRVFAAGDDAGRNTGTNKPFGIQIVYFYPERTGSFILPFAQKVSEGSGLSDERVRNVSPQGATDFAGASSCNRGPSCHARLTAAVLGGLARCLTMKGQARIRDKSQPGRSRGRIPTSSAWCGWRDSRLCPTVRVGAATTRHPRGRGSRSAGSALPATRAAAVQDRAELDNSKKCSARLAPDRHSTFGRIIRHWHSARSRRLFFSRKFIIE